MVSYNLSFCLKGGDIMKNIYLSVGIVVVVLVMIVFAFVRNRLSVGKFSAANPTPTPVAVEENKETISVNKHTPAASAVIDAVNLANPGFVAIHENQNGAPGPILGISELLPKGAHENIVISLSRKTVSGEELFAKVYADNGDAKFDSSDQEVKETNGNPLTAQFLVSSETNGFQIPATGLGEE